MQFKTKFHIFAMRRMELEQSVRFWSTYRCSLNWYFSAFKRLYIYYRGVIVILKQLLSYFPTTRQAKFHQSFSPVRATRHADTNRNKRISRGQSYLAAVGYVSAPLFSTNLLFNTIIFCGMKREGLAACINWIMNSRIFWFWIFKARQHMQIIWVTRRNAPAGIVW